MDKLDLEFKGYIDIYVKNEGSDKIIQEIHQENLFLINGRKLALSALNPYIILSTSVATPIITATTIPATVRQPPTPYQHSTASGTATVFTIAGTSVTKRCYFQFPAPTDMSDVIGTVGLAGASNGTSAIAYTLLSQTIARTINVTTLDVYYSITVNSY